MIPIAGLTSPCVSGTAKEPMKNIHPAAWASVALTGALTFWAQYGPAILPHLDSHLAQEVTAVVALIATFVNPKKQ